MSYAPCQNPNCKSFGKPHPNCHCVMMADGGEVPTFENTTPTEEEPTWENTTGEYESPGQQVLTGLEGAAQGFAGPVATGAELGLSKLGVPGISAQDITARQQANPWIHGLSEAGGLGAGLLTGVGEAGLLAKGAAAATGSKLIQGALANAAIAGGDEISKAMLGQGDPNHPVASVLANVGAAGLLGGIFEGGLGKLKDLNLGSKAASYLSGIGARASGSALEETARGASLLDKNLFDQKMFDLGQKAYDTGVQGAAYSGAVSAAHSLASTVGEKAYLAIPFIKNALEKPIGKVGQYAVPTITKWLSEGAPSELAPLLNYSSQLSKGQNLINSSIGGLFKEGIKQSNNAMNESHAVDDSMDQLDDWIKNGGIDSDIQNEIENQNSPIEQIHPGFAEGGSVEKSVIPDKKSGIFHDHPIAQIYPEQNMLLMAAKGRISNYLKGLRPQENTPKLAFDPNPDQTMQKRSYKKALRIATQPLSIMQDAAKGTLQPEDLQHFNALYPEMGQVLQQNITQRITEAQLKGEKPSYGMRQSLSLLMGTPLSSELSPHNIMAAQSVFAQAPKNQTPQGAGMTRNKKNTSNLTKTSQAYLTGSESVTKRNQKI